MKILREHAHCLNTAALALTAACLLAAPAGAQDNRPVRTDGSGVQEENDEAKEVRRRLKVMRTALKAFVEAGQHDRAHLVELAMHSRELSLEGRRDAEANSIREAAPDRGTLAELLANASELVAEQADQLSALSSTYAAQHLRRQKAEQKEREPLAAPALDSLENRVKILDWARAAHAEAGREQGAQSLARAVQYGRQLLAGADLPDNAAENVPSLPELVELVTKAAGLYGEWGHADRQRSCVSLALYYQERVSDEEGEDAREEEHSPEHGGDINELAQRIEIVRQAQAAYLEVGNERHARTLAQFLHVAELQQAGASGEAIMNAFEGLEMGMIIELLQGARKLYDLRGYETRAANCNRLAEFYAQRERDRGAEGERREAAVQMDYSQRARRIEVLHLAYDAHKNFGDSESTEKMERILKLAELQLVQADGERIAEAAEGLTQTMIIDLCDQAGDIYWSRGNLRRARQCEQLARHYRQLAEETTEQAEEGPITEIIERIERIEQELQEAKAALRRLRDR